MEAFRFFPSSHGSTLPLSDVIARLTAQTEVDSVLLMGSTAQDALTPTSDYDLLVVMTSMPEPLGLVHTSIDQRLAEIYFVTAAALEPILASSEHSVTGGALPQTGDQVALYTWMQTGQIVFDRSGRLTQAQNILKASDWFTPASETQRYRIWFGANYNLQHTKWIARSPDPLYQREVDVRLLFTVFFLFCDYFHLRGLRWQGSKAAMRWLALHDPRYLNTFYAFLDASSREDKLAIYEQLVGQTVAPYGAVWPDQATAIQLADGSMVTPEQIERALAWWEAMLQ